MYHDMTARRSHVFLIAFALVQTVYADPEQKAREEVSETFRKIDEFVKPIPVHEIVEINNFTDQNPMTLADYAKLVLYLKKEKHRNSSKFLAYSRKRIVSQMQIENEKAKHEIFSMSADYNEAVLLSVVAINEGFPIFDTTKNQLLEWTVILLNRAKTEDERQFMQTILATAIGMDKEIRTKLGIPNKQ